LPRGRHGTNRLDRTGRWQIRRFRLFFADGRIYLFDEEGTTTVLKPGRKLEVLATNTLPNGFMASPAVSGKAFFLRTKTDLYRIESLPAEGK